MSSNTSLGTNFETINIFFATLIVSCCLVMALPTMAQYPNVLLFCYFFIMISLVALFLNWVFEKKTPIYYILPSLLFIVISLIVLFLLVSFNKSKISQGYVTNYYYKFSLISIWLVLIECYLFYHLYQSINTDSVKIITIIIISFCVLNYFTVWSNFIGLKYFSADG